MTFDSSFENTYRSFCCRSVSKGDINCARGGQSVFKDSNSEGEVQTSSAALATIARFRTVLQHGRQLAEAATLKSL